MRAKVNEVAPGLNLMPLWLTKDLTMVTTNPVSVSLNAADVMEYLWDGVNESDCPLPCEIYSTETRHTDSTNSQGYIGFSITFQQNVEVTTIRVIKPTLFSFLSDVGGSLGLWLGLGVLQVLQQVIIAAQPVIKNFSLQS